ncbi:MAG TPA: tRNA pseudouridine(38-40) synthase TruA [Candidatus Acidoferrum sp.]|nr:tRNA pseudouridine(38-40) synthase TruA [Candidatus Acidoferrum sp.]
MNESLPPGRIALGVEYDGSAYSGWQTQLNPRFDTVQESLEAALSKVADHPVTVLCAGRTDAGVHASGQVVHFDTAAARPLKAWVQGTNSNLAASIAVRWARPVPAEFHARFSALSRRYSYLICNSPVRPAMYSHFLTHHYQSLDVERMQIAAQALLGENDFSSFRAAGCQSRTAMRCVTEIGVQRKGDLVTVEIEANAFLLHMVRNIVGTLMEIGQGDRPVEWAAELLALRDRTRAAPTASAQGLSLIQVRYPDHFGLPLANPRCLP